MSGSREQTAAAAGGPGGFPGWRRAGDLVVAAAAPPLGAGGSAASPDDATAQAEATLEALGRSLAEAGASFDDLVDVVSFHGDPAEIEPVLEVARGVVGAAPPAWTPIVAAGGGAPGSVLALHAIAHVGDAEKRCVTPDTIAWWRRFPIAAGCRKGDLVAVAGQYGSDADGNVNTPGDHGGQARNALNRVKEICTLLDTRLEDVVEVLSTHQDPRGIQPAAEIVDGEFLAGVAAERLPVWTAVGVPSLYGFGMLGQYRALAQAGAGSEALVAVAAATRAGGGDARAQIAAALEELDRGLAAAGCAAADLISVISFHKDPRCFAEMRAAVDERYRGRSAPAWTPVGMVGSRHAAHDHVLHALAVRADG